MVEKKYESKQIKIRTFAELVEFIGDMNNFKETIVLSGWFVEFQEDRPFIDTLIFETKPVHILAEDNDKIVKKYKKKHKKNEPIKKVEE